MMQKRSRANSQWKMTSRSTRPQKVLMRKTVKAILAGKKKEIDAMEAFGISNVCEEVPKGAKIIPTRWENVPKGDKWRCRFLAREFRHVDPEMEGTSGSTRGQTR